MLLRLQSKYTPGHRNTESVNNGMKLPEWSYESTPLKDLSESFEEQLEQQIRGSETILYTIIGSDK